MEVVKMTALRQDNIFRESGESQDTDVTLQVVPEPIRTYIAIPLLDLDQHDGGISTYTPLGRGPKAGVELNLGEGRSMCLELYAERDSEGWVTGIIDTVGKKDGKEVWRDTTERIMGERGPLLVDDNPLYRNLVNDIFRDSGFLEEMVDDGGVLNLHHTQRLYRGLESQLDTIF